MKAKQVLLVAMGSKKAEAVKELLQGEYSEECPATVLQRHPNVTVIAIKKLYLYAVRRLLMNIDKYSPFPIYYQIQEWVKQLIEDGEWKPGDKIPSENELCDKFEVSRMTIRQAINNLVEQGYLYRKRGIGTFVQLPKVEQNCKE